MRLRGAVVGLAALASVLLVTLAGAAALAFKFVSVGSRLPEMELARVGGGTAGYLGGEGDQASLFAFIKADQEGSEELLKILQELKPDYAGRPVHFALIISGRAEAAWADSILVRCPGATVLLDQGDALYGALGVPLTPVVGIGDGDHVLRAYLTYRKVHYKTVIDANLKFVLGDTTADELARSLAPSGNAQDSPEAAAGRKLKLARMLLDRGKIDSALSQTQGVLAEYPELSAAHRLLADIRRAQGDEEGAAAALRAALALENAATAPDTSEGGQPPDQRN